jgi:adenylate cyclase
MRKDIISFKNIVIFISIFLVFVLLISSDSFFHVRETMSDRLYGNKEPLDNILIIEIDDESINKIGRWPWDRSVHSELLKKLNNSKVIGIDISFFEESDDDFSLEETLSSMDNVVLAAEINENILLKPMFESEFGYVNLQSDFDGVTRSVRTGIHEKIYPFAFKIYQKSWNENIIFKEKEYKINFASSPGTFNSINYYDSLYGDSLENLENKIILIGATAPDLHDTYFVPTSEGISMSGVEIHANIIQNLILDNFLEKQSNSSMILIIFLTSLFGFFLLSRTKIYYSAGISILIILIYFYLSAVFFSKFNYVLDLFFFPLSMLIFTSSGIAINYFEEKKHSSYLTGAFGKYISKDLLKEIISKKHELTLGGSKRIVTIFFSDIRGFTSISEKLSPEDLVSLINDYLTNMTQIILEHRGTVDKFIGDAVMAFWNAPLIEEDHVELACKSALAQINALEKLQKNWKDKNLPEMKIGIGIHTGEAVIGNIGSEDRFDYTALGDSVNLSSRLESLTKQYGVDIIISEDSFKFVRNKFKFRKLDKVKVKGKIKPVTIYELCCDDSKKYVEFCAQYEKALNLYFGSKFKLAIKEFKKALKLKDDLSSQIFIKRCELYIKKNPGKTWDGSFELLSK